VVGDHEKYGDEEMVEFQVGVPSHGLGPSAIQLYSEHHASDTAAWLHDRGIGISGLAISVKGRQGHGKYVLGTGEIASTVSLKW